MSYNNKQYNTRHSQGRYNTPGRFVAAGEQQPPLPPTQQLQSSSQLYQPQQQRQQQPQQPQRQQQPPLPPQPPQNPNLQSIQTEDVDMKPIKNDYDNGVAGADGDGPQRPHWMKSKLAGVKKLSNKERRRRQNENLRRLITPKNALMVLNEMLPGEQVTNQFKVEPFNPANQMGQQFGFAGNKHAFQAGLTINGTTYTGYGESKMTARNVAAEQAIRDLIIKKMHKYLGAEGHDVGDENEEALPMIQLASFALHKLFYDWESTGHKVPQLKASQNSMSESGSEMAPAPTTPKPKPPKPQKELPSNAASMHPCMLLTYMRSALEYRELAVDGDKPPNMTFTMGVDVDGSTYIGKAQNKKEARKQAAKAACQALFGVRFTDNPSENVPITA